MSDKDGGQTGTDALSRERAHFLCYFLFDCRGNRNSIEDFCHQFLPFNRIVSSRHDDRSATPRCGAESAAIHLAPVLAIVICLTLGGLFSLQG